MKTPPPASSLIEFPTPENGSAIALGSLPSISSFPTHFDGEAYQIAVPAVIYLDIPEGIPINQVIAEAVEWVGAGEIVLYQDVTKEDGITESFGISGSCRPMASTAKIQLLPDQQTRLRMLSDLREASVGIGESMKSDGLYDSMEVERVSDEIRGILDILILSGQPHGLVKAS